MDNAAAGLSAMMASALGHTPGVCDRATAEGQYAGGHCAEVSYACVTPTLRTCQAEKLSEKGMYAT